LLRFIQIKSSATSAQPPDTAYYYRMTENTIASVTVDCLSRFQNFLDEWMQMTPPDSSFGISELETELGRFRLWVNNIGGGNQGRSGLDYRLRDAQYIRTNVKALIMDLGDAIQDGTRVSE
jgi:hypothetical protein